MIYDTIHLQPNLHLGRKEGAIYTLVASALSLQTLVCVYPFRLQRWKRNNFNSCHLRTCSRFRVPCDRNRCNTYWAGLAVFPERERRDCLIGCVYSLSFTVSKAALIIHLQLSSTMLGDKVQLEFKKSIYLVFEHHIVNSSAKSHTRCPPLSSPCIGRSTQAMKILSSPTRDLVVSNWKQRDVNRGCPPETRPAVARWLLGQPVNQSV